MKSARISFYGNFGAGNLGNECTLQTTIEQTLQRLPDAQLLCFCTNPEDVRTRHNISAFRSEARRQGVSWVALEAQGTDQSAAQRVGSRSLGGRLARIFRITFCGIPLELLHWVRSLRAVSGTDVLIVAGTGIVADYMCGPLGWPYDIFKLSTLAALCRVKLVFLSIGVGPISHPLSRWFLKRSLALAQYRSYRDEASKQYMEKIGFSTGRDAVYPDVVFGLSPRHLVSKGARPGERRVIGVGLKDYGAPEGLGASAYRAYLDTMAAFVSWLQEHDYSVRLLVGDVQYDTRVIEDLLDILKTRNISAEQPLPTAEPALTVEELLRQLGETDAVVSSRYHNLVMALILNKPVMALSDHAKLDSLLTEFGLAQYRVPLKDLRLDGLIDRFKQLVNDAEQLKPYIRGEVEKYRQALDEQYASVLAGSNVGA